MRNLPLTFDSMYCSQKLWKDFAKFCGLLRIYELYVKYPHLSSQGVKLGPRSLSEKEEKNNLKKNQFISTMQMDSGQLVYIKVRPP